eukprot:519038_1
MRTVSMICVVLQSIYLSLFVVTYSITTATNLPILWAISCAIFAANFIRNRVAVSHCFFRLSTPCRNRLTMQDSSHNHGHDLKRCEGVETGADATKDLDTDPIRPRDHAQPRFGDDGSGSHYKETFARTTTWKAREFADVTDVRMDVMETSIRRGSIGIIGFYTASYTHHGRQEESITTNA